ncbi:MAG: tetratricopeptide repeat-containing sulfotransferase family protein, partial [Alphaproteobacteria bacterium]
MMAADPNKLFIEAMSAINAGDYEGARQTFIKINRMAPGNADVLSYLGFAEASMGMSEGLAKTAKAAEELPESPQILMNYAFALSQSGHHARAIEVLKQANQAIPNKIPIFNQLSRLLVEAGAFAEAEPYTRLLVDKAPKDPVFANRHVKVLAALKKGEEALEFVKGLEKTLPRNRFLQELKAHAARAAQNWPESYRLYKKLSEGDPKSLTFKRGLAHSLMGLEDFSSLVPVLKEIHALDPENEQVIYSMAFALFNDHRHEECLPFIEQILSRDPENIDALIIKGRSLISFGEFEDAEKIFLKILKLSPDHPMAVMQLTKVKRPTTRDATFDKIEEMEKTTTDEHDYRALMGYTLGEMYEGIKDYDKAFHYFQLGNERAKSRFAKRGFVFDRDKTKASFNEIKKHYSKEMLSDLKGKGAVSEVPIFIVAMPRSGTTLLEQVISSHSKVYGGGELPLGNAAAQKLKSDLGQVTPEKLKDKLAVEAQTYANLYLDYLPGRGPGETRLSDKMPNNFMHLGFLQTILPKASYIYIKRHPLDICLSIYKGFFGSGFTYALDLEDLGFYFRQHHELMAYWRGALPLPILEVRYEDFVADPEGQGKRI